MAGTDSGPGPDAGMPRIVKTEDVLGGDPRIEGHRIGVHHVYQRSVKGGESPEEIAASYDISLAEVHAALAYAFSNPDEMREIEERDQALFEERSSERLTPDDTG